MAQCRMHNIERVCHTKTFSFSTMCKVSPAIDVYLDIKTKGGQFCELNNWKTVDPTPAVNAPIRSSAVNTLNVRKTRSSGKPQPPTYHAPPTQKKAQSITFTARGGVLADEMGLGKSVTVISLIVNNPRKLHATSNTYVPLDRSAANPEVKEIKTTLILCPSQLVSQWGKEIENCSSLKFKCCNTYKDYNDPSISACDVIIVSHNAFFNYSKNPEHTAVFRRYGWHRIVLDEGHQVLAEMPNTNHVVMDPVSLHTELWKEIHSNFNWYVTGTPVPLGRASLIGLAKFIRLGVGRYFDFQNANPRFFPLEHLLFTEVRRCLVWRNTKVKVVDLQHLVQGRS